MPTKGLRTTSENSAWREAKKSIYALLIGSAIVAGLLRFFGNPFSLEDLIVGALAIGVLVVLQFGEYLERRFDALEARGVAVRDCVQEADIVGTLNELNQRLKHIEKEVDFIART